jgi:AraC-like DNA-binding protein
VPLDEMPADFSVHRFSTEQLPAGARLDVWRDILTRKLLRVAIDPIADEPFHAKAALRAQHGVRMGIGFLGATVSHRTRGIVADDNDDLALLANLGGPFIAKLRGDELDLAAGDACLVDCRDAGVFIRPKAGKLLCVRMPRAMLAAYSPRLARAVGRRIPGATDPLRLLVSYVTTLCEAGDVAMTSEMSHIVVRHVCDLAALCLGAAGDGAQLAEARGLRAARLKAVKKYINANIGPYPLSAEAVAAEHGIGVRYVRKLFESEDTSFSSYVTELRLERARTLLTEPRNAATAVSVIAYDVGFGDLSYFNRAFRRRYGATPSDVRAEALTARRA